MPAYLKFFELEKSPFEGQAQAQVVLGTRALRDAFATIQTGLAEGASRICVSGARGLGKTSLGRALPKLLGSSARVARVLDPAISWEAARGPLAKQWGLASGGLARAALLDAARDCKLVLVIDQAEKASQEFLDHLDVVLSYRREDGRPVVQSVLLARLTTGSGETPSPLIWWLDRIQTLQLEFAPLPRSGVESYIQNHLKRAGWSGDRLFSEEAAQAIHDLTGGVPGAVSSLCERLLSEAAAQNLTSIDADFVHAVCNVGGQGEDETETEEEFSRLADEFEKLALEDEFEDAGVESDDTTDPGAISFGELCDAADAADVGLDADRAFDATKDMLGEAPGNARKNTPGDAFAESPEHIESARKAAIGASVTFAPTAPAVASVAALSESGWASENQPESHATSGTTIDAGFEAVWADDDPLNAPPTAAELRAIRGSGWMRLLRTFAAAAVLAILGGIGISMFAGEPETPRADLSDSLGRTTQKSDPNAPRESGTGGSPRPQTPPIDAAKPLVLIQPGGQYVPVEAPRNAERSSSPPTKGSQGTRLEQTPGTEPGSARPAAAAPFSDDSATREPARNR